MIVDRHTVLCNRLVEKLGSSSHTVTYVKWSIRSCWGSSSSCHTWFLLGPLSGAIYSLPHPWPHTCTPRFERPKSIKAWTHHRHVHVSYTFRGHTAGKKQVSIGSSPLWRWTYACDHVSIWPEPKTSNWKATVFLQLSARNLPETHRSPLMHPRPPCTVLSCSLFPLCILLSPFHSPLATLLCACALMTTT